VETVAEFNTAVQKSIDATVGATAVFGVKATPRIGIDALLIDWDSVPKGMINYVKNFKSKFSGNFGIVALCPGEDNQKFILASKAGVNAFLIKPFKQEDLKQKLIMVLSGKSEPIVQGFNLNAASQKSSKQGFGSNPFAFKQAVEKKKPTMSKSQSDNLLDAVLQASMDQPEGNKVVTKSQIVSASQLKGGVKGRASFYRGGGGKRSDTVVATLVDGKIDGHYHQKVDVVGGAENCFWAKEQEGDMVRLEYLNAKGKPTGIEAKVIKRDIFMHSFFLCSEHGCSILKRLGEWSPADES
jgi:DNA-binding NarL/FixJ family response regulator